MRNTFSGAVSYNIPSPKSGWYKPLLRNWAMNSIVYARSSPPVNFVTGNVLPGTIFAGASSVQRQNVVPGLPWYISGPTAPGGKIINKAAFTVPASGQGDLGRNALRGFGASKVDFTLQRMFKLSERFALKSNPHRWLGSGGQSGGLNPLYHIGGPRSMQLASSFSFEEVGGRSDRLFADPAW